MHIECKLKAKRIFFFLLHNLKKKPRLQRIGLFDKRHTCTKCAHPATPPPHTNAQARTRTHTHTPINITHWAHTWLHPYLFSTSMCLNYKTVIYYLQYNGKLNGFFFTKERDQWWWNEIPVEELPTAAPIGHIDSHWKTVFVYQRQRIPHCILQIARAYFHAVCETRVRYASKINASSIRCRT